MSKKVKGLWIGDGVFFSGFSRVNHSIIENLGNKFDIHHLAINYFGDPHKYKHKIYPAKVGVDFYGLKRMIPLIKEVKPDFIFILNDIWVIDKYLRILKKHEIKIPIIIYFPVDAAHHDKQWYSNCDIVSQMVVYTKFAQKVVAQATGIDPKEIMIIPHGASEKDFFEFDSFYDKDGKILRTSAQVAREKLFPIDKYPEVLDSFIVLNANRNQPRKRIDITIKAFAEFAKDKPNNVKLYLHMGSRDAGVDINRLAHTTGISDRLIVTAGTPSPPQVSEEALNVIYNATDIGITNSLGEGWGLTSWEHGLCGRPQIVSNHSALAELWYEDGFMIDAPYYHYMDNITTMGMVPDHDSVVEQLELAYQMWLTDREAFIACGQKTKAKISQNKYSWKTIAKQWKKLILENIKRDD